MDKKKFDFITNELPVILKKLDPQAKGLWGKMNVQQMIEHMSDSFREAGGKIPRKILTVAEKLPAMKDFLMSEKEFKPNTRNVLMGDDPAPVRNASVRDAIVELEKEIKDFKNHFASFTDSTITNPFFGELNFEEWIQLLHKHAIHHLKQFGVEIN